MDRSNQPAEDTSFNLKLDAASGENVDYDQLYDEAWRSEESDATSLLEVPIDYLHLERNDYDHTVNSAIAEISNEFLSGKIGPFRQAKNGNSDESHSDTEFKLVKGLAYVAHYPETAAGMSDNDWNPYTTESDTNVSPRILPQGPMLSGSRKSSLMSFNPQLHSTDMNANTPSAVIYSIPGSDSHSGNSNEQSESKTYFLLQPDTSSDFSTLSIARQTMNLTPPLVESSVKHEYLNKTFRGSNSAGPSMSTKLSHKSTVDYNLLQKELQDIQDNLHVLNPEMKLDLSEQGSATMRQSGDQSCVSSGSECDIIPSTTATPDRQSNQLSWDNAADVGYRQPGFLLGDISLNTLTADTDRRLDEKKGNSDGDETRTSDSSERMAHHTSADEVLVEVSDVLHPQQMGNHHTSCSHVDQMIWNFETQRQLIESGYQQLNYPGLAEKVSRILASQDPQSQASGILSDVTARERRIRSQLIINPQLKDFSLSAASSDFNESNESLAKPDNVRKRLDLSGLSSTDVSKNLESSSMYVPVRKGFAVLDDVARLLSSQMVKVSERTFNSSLEMVVPQRTVQCYPLTTDNRLQPRVSNEQPDEEEKTSTDHTPENVTNRLIETDRPEHTNSSTGMYADNQNSNVSHSQDDSDSSSSRRRDKYRPYRPAGSKEVYYTESDGASVADSATTMESTHFGSDDARGPVLPPSALGSRQEAPNAVGIYGNRKPLIKQQGDTLPPIQEKSGLQDERESETSQSHQGDLASESLRSHGRSPDSTTPVADGQGIGDPRKNDNSSQCKDTITEGRYRSSREEGKLVSQHKETNPATEGSSLTNDRWANRRNKKEHNTVGVQKVSKNRTEMQKSENDSSLSQLTGYDEFHSVGRQYQTPGSYYKRGTDLPIPLGISRDKDRTTQPVSQRGQSPYHDDGDRLSTDQKLGASQGLSNNGRNLYTTTGISASSASRLSSDSVDGHYIKRYNDAENGLTCLKDPHSLLQQRNREDRLLRSHSDEDLYTSGRDEHLPRKSSDLSPNWRMTRGPAMFQDTEKPIRLPPSGWPSYHQSNVSRSQSPPPTFLARERGQDPRPYVASLRQPVNLRRQYKDYSLSSRTVSVAQDEEDLQQLSQTGNSADRRKDVDPESDSSELDHQPVSQRAQLLTQALAQGTEPDVQLDIDSLWEKFKAGNESSETALETSSLEAITDLILSPSPHLVTQCLKEREEQLMKQQEKAEAAREKWRAEWRENRRVNQSSSEEDVNAGYTERISKKEEDQLKRRAARKKKGKSNTGDAELDNFADSLFSIAEDASREQTPVKYNAASPQISNVPRRTHIIDPYMKKLRERISKQRQIIDKSTLKELQKIDKLKKLEELLLAKKRNEINDDTLRRKLEEISSASTPVSDDSQNGLGKPADSYNTTPLSDDSTTAKDSSTEMYTWKANKEARIKMMKAKEVEYKNKCNAIKTGEHKSGLSTRIAHQREQLNAVSSESKLLKLVAEGILTAEEAYRIAVQREASNKDKAHEAGYTSSMHDIYDRQNRRLHKLISPYAREDTRYIHKSHHVPKLKSPPSVYDVTDLHLDSKFDPDNQQNFVNTSSVTRPPTSGARFRSEYIPKASHKAQPAPGSRQCSARPAPSTAKASLQVKQSRGPSPSRPSSEQAFSPVRHSVRTSPHRPQSPTRSEERISPTRSLSFSLKNKENKMRQRSTSNRSSRRENAHKSEKKSLLQQKSPERGGIAWHIPLDVPQNNWKSPDARTARGMPLQERKLVTNTLPRKARQQTLPAEDMEPLQGWQMRKQMDHAIWQKTDHSPAVHSELWEHDTLASKSNHRDVDPLMDKVQFILSKNSANSSTEDEKRTPGDRKLSKMSLQEAFLTQKQGFISKCKERQKRLALASKHRKLQECFRLEREALFMEQRSQAAANLNAHPYSDNLYQPRRRFFSKQEMKEITMKNYKKLPEVLQQQESVKKREQCQLNRLRADIFNRKVQREALRKQSMRRR